MGEEIIEFETAKLAKEKGFDIYYRWSYYQNLDGEVLPVSGTPGYTLEDGKHSDYDSYLYSNRYMCPSIPVLQEWLRNEHNIYSFIDWLNANYVVFKTAENGNDIENIKITPFYEKESYGINQLLQEALNLIKDDK